MCAMDTMSMPCGLMHAAALSRFGTRGVSIALPMCLTTTTVFIEAEAIFIENRAPKPNWDTYNRRPYLPQVTFLYGSKNR